MVKDTDVLWDVFVICMSIVQEKWRKRCLVLLERL